MGNFDQGRGNRFGGGNRGGGGRPSFGGGRPSFRREDRGPVTMTQVTCDECKKPCEVPFRPTAGKPVYCNDCFRNHGGGSQDRGPRKDFNRPAPRSSFGSNDPSQIKSQFDGAGGGNDIKKQLESLNVKLDKLISSIENLSQGKSAQKTEIVKSMTVSTPKKEVKKSPKKKVKK